MRYELYVPWSSTCLSIEDVEKTTHPVQKLDLEWLSSALWARISSLFGRNPALLRIMDSPASYHIYTIQRVG